MAVKPVPTDDNSWKMADRASEFFTARPYIDATEIDIDHALDIKGCAVFVESGGADVYIKGNAAGSKVYLAAVAISSQAGGKVRLTTGRVHNIPVGATVTPVGLANYTGTYTVTDVPSTTTLQFVATYVAETPATTDYLVGGQDLVFSAGEGFDLPVVIPAGETVFSARTASSNATLSIFNWR